MIEYYAIETYLRIRPKEIGPKIGLKIRDVLAKNGSKRQLLKVEIPFDADPTFIHNNDSGMLTFEFDKIFDENSSQEDVYYNVVEKKVVEVLDGVNSTIFAYGQTGIYKYVIFFHSNFHNFDCYHTKK